MASFYRDVLGLTVLAETDATGEDFNRHVGIPNAKRWLVFVGKKQSSHRLELVYYEQPESPDGHLQFNALGSTHVAFSVQDLDGMYRDLKDKGLNFVTPPVRRDSPFGRINTAFAHDPEGNWLEFLERLSD